MKFRFITRSLPLVIAGVGLGLLARFIFGVPEPANEMQRQFHQPVNQDLLESDEFKSMDIPLDARYEPDVDQSNSDESDWQDGQ